MVFNTILRLFNHICVFAYEIEQDFAAILPDKIGMVSRSYQHIDLSYLAQGASVDQVRRGCPR